jgi:hypothetical protein
MPPPDAFMHYNAEEHEPKVDVKSPDELARKNCRISPIESKVEQDVMRGAQAASRHAEGGEPHASS